jgi:hypothetical protein
VLSCVKHSCLEVASAWCAELSAMRKRPSAAAFKDHNSVLTLSLCVSRMQHICRQPEAASRCSHNCTADGIVGVQDVALITEGVSVTAWGRCWTAPSFATLCAKQL